MSPGIADMGLAKRGRWVRAISAVGVFVFLTACAPSPDLYQEPEVMPLTQTRSMLRDLPLPPSAIPVAVYEFKDQTGQFKPQEKVQTLSRAVSQGGAAILIQALQDAGRGRWFSVLERNSLANLLKERQIIQEMRARYLNERVVNPRALPPLLFAGIILEGGIVGFDSNTLTGGLGAKFLGIGGNVDYRQNTITVNLRAVSVKTGEILANVTTTKTLSSIGIQGGVFKFVSFDELLEAEAGVTTNEPGVMALRRTIEKAVLSLILEGADARIWAFAEPASAKPLLRKYRSESSLGHAAIDEADDTGFLSDAALDRQRAPLFREGDHAAMRGRRPTARMWCRKCRLRNQNSSSGLARSRARLTGIRQRPIRVAVRMPRVFSGVATGRIGILTRHHASGRRVSPMAMPTT